MTDSTRPGKIVCVGRNYRAHAKELGNEVPAEPLIFLKPPSSVIRTGGTILLPTVSAQIEYEGEIGVVIGTTLSRADEARAERGIRGIVALNDVTARDLQGKYSQWLIGKSQDTFCPMGPWAVTQDELDLATAGIRCFVNEDLRQDSRISLLIFDIPTIIATLSQGITLKPGDIIATGTPVGVGIGFDPPRYLKPGDVVRIEIDGIGTLENRVAEHAQ